MKLDEPVIYIEPTRGADQRSTILQAAAVGAVTPNYNGNGNLTFDGTFAYSHDAESRLTAAVGGGNNTSYAYDGFDRLMLF